MAEYLINTMNRQDNYMADLLLLQVKSGLRSYIRIGEAGRGLIFIRCRHCVSSASSRISKYPGQQ